MRILRLAAEYASCFVQEVCIEFTVYDNFVFLESYFYVTNIFYDKTYFTCNWVDLSSFKNIMTSGFIEDMKITQETVQEKLKQVVSTPLIYQDLINLNT